MFHLSRVHSQVLPEPFHRGRVAHFRAVGEQYGALHDHSGHLLLVQAEVGHLTAPKQRNEPVSGRSRITVDEAGRADVKLLHVCGVHVQAVWI